MTPDEIREAEIMRMSGKTYAEIGLKFGVTKQRIHQLVGDKSVVAFDEMQREKCYKTIESLISLKKYQSSVVKVVIDDTIAVILGLMNKVEQLEKERKVQRNERKPY